MNIELTEEQYIDSIQSLLEDFLRAHADQISFVSDKAVYEFIEDYKTLLTTTQLQQLCEQHGGSFVQWHEFDVNNLQYRQYLGGILLTRKLLIADTCDTYEIRSINDIRSEKGLWCEMPTPSKEK